MTIKLGHYFGIHVYRMPDALNRPYLCATIWYPRSRKLLGYFYPSIRWF